MKCKIRKLKFVAIGVIMPLFIITAMASKTSKAQDLVKFENRMTEFTLDNGMKFLVLERHEAPVVSFHTYADVGAVDEVKGITGMAHLFEHMAFKGTRNIGTTDYKLEDKALTQADQTGPTVNGFSLRSEWNQKHANVPLRAIIPTRWWRGVCG